MKYLLRLTTAALATALIAPIVSMGQPFLEMLSPDTAQGVVFKDFQRAFFDWSAENDLTTSKGWKWYKRWEAFQEQRALPNGTLPDASIFLETAVSVANKKQTSQALIQNSSWSPVGPIDLPTTHDPSLTRGMGRINCVEFHPADPNTMWVGVAQGGVWKTVNNGESWLPLTDDLPILRISDITVDPNNVDIIYISVGDYAYLGTDLENENRKRNTHYGLGVYKTTNGGNTWHPTGLSFSQTERDVSLIRRVFVLPDAANQLLAAGISGVWRSSDAGNSWRQIHDELIWDIEQDPVSPNIIYASGGWLQPQQMGRVSLMRSIDFGETWTQLDADIPERDQAARVEIAISPTDPDYVYALACDNSGGFFALYRSTDAGASWRIQSNGVSAPNILHWSSGGGSGGQGTYDLAILVDPLDKERIYIGGINIWASHDGGVSWDGVSFWTGRYGPSIHADQHFLAYNPLNDQYVVCNDGGIYATDEIIRGSWQEALENEGSYEWPTQWRNLSGGIVSTSFYRLGLSAGNPDVVIAGAQDNSTYFTQGQGWVNIIGGDGMECLVHPDDPDIIYGSSQFGNFVKSTDGGQFFEYALTSDITDGFGEQGAWTTPFTMHPDNPETLFTAYGNVWRSDDGGFTWLRLSNFVPLENLGFPTPASALAVARSNPDYIYVARRIIHAFDQPSELWRTTVGGTTWTNITAGLPDSLWFSYIAVHDLEPRLAWVACGGFIDGAKVFQTTNGGETWTNISENLPNIPVNCIVHEPNSENTQIYIGTDIGVYFTNDDLNGWHLYSSGLPNVIVSELEIHEQTGKIYAATFGRGVWKADLATGPVSVNDDNPLAGIRAEIAPNPTDGAFVLSMENLNGLQNVTLEIVDIAGRKVYAAEKAVVHDRLTARFDLNVPYGKYYLRIINGVYTKVLNFVVLE